MMAKLISKAAMNIWIFRIFVLYNFQISNFRHSNTFVTGFAKMCKQHSSHNKFFNLRDL